MTLFNFSEKFSTLRNYKNEKVVQKYTLIFVKSIVKANTVHSHLFKSVSHSNIQKKKQYLNSKNRDEKILYLNKIFVLPKLP